MKHYFVTLIVLCAMYSILDVAHAKASDKGFGKSDIDGFCSTHSHQVAHGTQFIETGIMRLQPGKYSYPGQGALLLFANGHYLLQLPLNRNGIHGTSGDDLLASGGIVGGCSKEQLSEALQNNQLQVSSFQLIKRYK